VKRLFYGAHIQSEAAVTDSTLPKLIPFSGLKALGIPHSRWTLRNLEKRGLFPARLRLSPRKNVWLEIELKAFLDAAIAARGAK
jgi:predicted DNA-binding transcriptional regulator AlpA